MKKTLLIAALALGLGFGYLTVGISKAQAVSVPFKDIGSTYGPSVLTIQGFDGVTRSLDPTYQPGDYGLDPVALGLDLNVDTTGDGNPDKYGETWGVWSVDIISDSVKTPPPGDYWRAHVNHTENLYLFFRGMYDKTIIDTGASGEAAFNILTVGGEWGLYLSTDLDNSDEYLTSIANAPDQRSAIDAFDSITDQGELVLSGVFGPGVMDSSLVGADQSITVFQEVSSATSPAQGRGLAYGDITDGTVKGTYDSDGITDSWGVDHDILFNFLVEPPGVEIANAGWDQEVSGDTNLNVVPEPATVALLGIGLVGMAGVAIRRKLSKKALEKS